jgi:hybrid cluster-associated redox disulfide protein
MINPTIEEQMGAPIEVILGKWPKASRVFIGNRMNCIGCAFAKFHTLKDACEIYQLDKENILEEMRDLLNTKEERDIANDLANQD